MLNSIMSRWNWCKKVLLKLMRIPSRPTSAKPHVSGALLSDEEIREAADEWVFVKNGTKWSNNDNTAGDNYGSFMAGVKWALSRLCNDR